MSTNGTGVGVRRLELSAAEADYLAAAERLGQLRTLAAQIAMRIAEAEVAVASLRRAAGIELSPRGGKRRRSGITERVRGTLPATRAEVYAALEVRTPHERQRVKQTLLNLRYSGQVVLDESVDPPVFRLVADGGAVPA